VLEEAGSVLSARAWGAPAVPDRPTVPAGPPPQARAPSSRSSAIAEVQARGSGFRAGSILFGSLWFPFPTTADVSQDRFSTRLGGARRAFGGRVGRFPRRVWRPSDSEL